MFGEEGVNGAAQVADAFSVNDSNLEDAAFAAGVEVIGDEIFDIFWAEGVEVEDAVDRDLDGIVHVLNSKC